MDRPTKTDIQAYNRVLEYIEEAGSDLLYRMSKIKYMSDAGSSDFSHTKDDDIVFCRWDEVTYRLPVEHILGEGQPEAFLKQLQEDVDNSAEMKMKKAKEGRRQEYAKLRAEFGDE